MALMKHRREQFWKKVEEMEKEAKEKGL